MHIHKCLYIYKHNYIHVYIYTHIYIHIFIDMYVYMCLYVYTHLYIYQPHQYQRYLVTGPVLIYICLSPTNTSLICYRVTGPVLLFVAYNSAELCHTYELVMSPRINESRLTYE